MTDTYTMSITDKSDPEFKDIYLFHGKSAYQAAVEEGFIGTEAEWIASLKDLYIAPKAEWPEEGNIHYIYIDSDTTTSTLYRWDPTINNYRTVGGTLGETADTAYRGDRGKIAYEHSQSQHVALDHHHTVADIDDNLPATRVIDNETHRFITDDERTYWNGARAYTDQKIATLADDAPETLDTLKELAKALGDDPDFAATMTKELAKKATNEELQTYIKTLTLEGQTLTITDGNGNPKTFTTQDTVYTLPVAGATLGGVKSGGGDVNILSDGTIDVLQSGRIDNSYYKGLTKINMAKPGMNYYSGSFNAGNDRGLINAYYDGLSHILHLNNSPWSTSLSDFSAQYADIAIPGDDASKSIAYRVFYQNESIVNWRVLLDEANYNKYALPLTGGKITGTLAIEKSNYDDGLPQLIIGLTDGNIMQINHNSIQAFNSSESPDILNLNSQGGLVNIGSGGLSATGNISTSGNITATGTISGSKVYNAVFNDYAEWFERLDCDETINVGEIVVWKDTGVTRSYRSEQNNIIGVYSDSYGHIVGGENLDNMEDNIKKFIPVGLSGRVNVKVIGPVKPGDLIVTSDVPGVGKAYTTKWYQFWKRRPKIGTVIGKALECDKDGKVKIMIQIM